jgi:hypothetical protein
MQLRIARLCLDCEEIHAEQQCPVCASEAFTFIKRWIPAPERRSRPRTENSPGPDGYRRSPANDDKQDWTGQLMKRAAVGLAAASVAGWLWRRTTRPDHIDEPPVPRSEPEEDRNPV